MAGPWGTPPSFVESGLLLRLETPGKLTAPNAYADSLVKAPNKYIPHNLKNFREERETLGNPCPNGCESQPRDPPKALAETGPLGWP